MFCIKCGAKLDDESIFCHNCGAKAKKESQEAVTKENVTKENIQEASTESQLQSQQVIFVRQESPMDQEKPMQQEAPMQQSLLEKQHKNKKNLIIYLVTGAGVALLAIIVTFSLLLGNGKNSEESVNQQIETVVDKNADEEKEAHQADEATVETDVINQENPEEQQAETDETRFAKMLQEMNTSDNVLEKIAVYEENYKPEKRKSSYKWNTNLFYTLEEISPDSYEDGKINYYSIEKKQLYNADTNNLMEYEIYRNPETNAVNKIVSIEYKDDVLEITDYYYTDQGKVNFIFKREDINYVPSYATPDKSGRRYYFSEDTMVKWRIVKEGKQTNYVAGKEEEERGGNAGSVTWYAKLNDEKKKSYDETEKRMLNAAYNTYHTVLQAKGISNIVGYVADHQGLPLASATIHLYAEEYANEAYSCQTNAEGKYSIVIPSEERNFRIEVTKDGYVATKLFNINQNTQLIGVYQETICLVESSLDMSCNTQFVISDAFNRAYDNSGMARIDYATINVRPGINNKTGEISGSALTDAEGIVYQQLKPGMYTVEVMKAGYAVTYYNISVVKDNMIITINTTPVLYEGEVRIVLTWNDTPFDLDSHLFTPYDSISGDTTYHIWYGNKYDNNGNNLDVDDTDGYGPETMTINNLGHGLYKFYVADYTNCSTGYVDSTAMAYSKAKVDIYTADGLVSTFHVPANRPGVIWEVFEIRNKRIVPLQRYYSNLDNKTWWNNEK